VENFSGRAKKTGAVVSDKKVDFIGRKRVVNNMRIKVNMLSSKPDGTFTKTVARGGNQIVNGMFSRKNPVF
jgi:hypothetical protein